MAGAEEDVTVAESSVTDVNGAVGQETSNEATIQTNAQTGTTDSTCNNNNVENGETSAPLEDEEKSLELAAELTEKGSQALRESDYAEAVECFSRALEIRVSHYGELAGECLSAYYQYGRALLYKAQDEADPLATVPKKESAADKDGSVKSVKTGESSAEVSVSSHVDEVGSSNHQVRPAGDVLDGKDGEEEGEDGENSEDEDLAEGDEDESDLDLAWKMLDVARAIAEKQPGDDVNKVDILSALAEVALEREDIETSLSDYQKALSILERIVEPDSRHLAELNFRMCLCLEIGSKPQEAVPFCQKAISVCKSRLQRLITELKGSSQSATSLAVSEESVQQSSTETHRDQSSIDKEAEIETLTGLSGELEKKLEDLQQLSLNPKSILSEILGMACAKVRGGEKSEPSAVLSSTQMGTANSSGGFDSPTVSTAHTNGAAGVTHLGVVGRGVKRVLMSSGSGSAESSLLKKPSVDSSSDKGEGK